MSMSANTSLHWLFCLCIYETHRSTFCVHLLRNTPRIQNIFFFDIGTFVLNTSKYHWRYQVHLNNAFKLDSTNGFRKVLQFYQLRWPSSKSCNFTQIESDSPMPLLHVARPGGWYCSGCQVNAASHVICEWGAWNTSGMRDRVPCRPYNNGAYIMWNL